MHRTLTLTLTPTLILILTLTPTLTLTLIPNPNSPGSKVTYASKRLREAVEAVRGCRSHGAGSEARYLLRWHFFSMHRQYDAILQSDLDLEVCPLALTP